MYGLVVLSFKVTERGRRVRPSSSEVDAFEGVLDREPGPELLAAVVTKRGEIRGEGVMRVRGEMFGLIVAPAARMASSERRARLGWEEEPFMLVDEVDD